MSIAYPQPPWSLRGDMFVALVKMPPNTVPAEIVPACARQRPDRSMTLAVAFVDYQPGGQLSYREFLVGATNQAMLGTGTILKIWVDTMVSLAGGRELWFIPKDLADFDVHTDGGFTGTVTVDGQKALAYSYTPTLTLPGRWTLPNTLLQEHDGAVRRTKSKFRARFQLGKGTLDIADSGPVSFLRQGRVLRHVAMRDFTATFGIRSELVHPKD